MSWQVDCYPQQTSYNSFLDLRCIGEQEIWQEIEVLLTILDVKMLVLDVFVAVTLSMTVYLTEVFTF